MPRSVLAVVMLVLTWNALFSASIEIKPYAQWTFATPLEEVHYRPDGRGFPISLIRTDKDIQLYDSTGAMVRTVMRQPSDKFVSSIGKTGFMLVQSHESILATDQTNIYSFQVYDEDGMSQYTSVVELDVFADPLKYQLTEDLNILLNIPSQGWMMELHADDTLLFVPDCGDPELKLEQPFLSTGRLRRPNEYVTARTCQEPVSDDSLMTELRIWNHDETQAEALTIAGRAKGLVTLPSSDYYFLELEHEFRSSLQLFHRGNALEAYPWSSWKIELLDPRTAFVISENDLNVINLSDGTLISSVHPIDLPSVSDACYLKEFGLFLYLRYETFYTEEGKQAFRKFELEGIEKSGRIVHKSTFGSWSYSLPKISPLGKDLFAIHIYNAVLLYRMNLNR